jgi:hypothetical protein
MIIERKKKPSLWTYLTEPHLTSISKVQPGSNESDGKETKHIPAPEKKRLKD